MNLFFTTLISIFIFHNAHAIQAPITGVHFLNWISHQTEWPVVFEKKYSSMNGVSEYDWYRYDHKQYVTEMPNYKPNYFVSKEPFKSELSIFGYDTNTNEPLTTYEAIPQMEYDYLPFANYVPEYHHLAYLKSHRIRIDRDQKNTHANITCIADILVDKNSLDLNEKLVDEMRKLALFKIELNEETRADFGNLIKRLERKNRLIQNNDRDGQFRGKKRQHRRVHKRIQRDKRDIESDKYIMNVRLSFGPINVPQPFTNRLISCSLDLVNHKTLEFDYSNKIYQFLSQTDLGLDKNYEDSLEEKNAKAFNEQDRIKSKEIIETSTMRVENKPDSKLNKIFETEKAMDKLEQEIAKEKQQEEKLQKVVEEVQRQEKMNELETKEHERREHEKKEHELEHKFLELDKDMLFELDRLDSPFKLDYNSANKNVLNYRIMLVLAFLLPIFY